MEELPIILEGCKKKDARCQEALYRYLYPAMFGLCKSFFSDNHDVLTALNNGMLKVFKNINQYDVAKGTFFSWSYTIIRNAALTLIRDKKNILTYELKDNMQETGSPHPFKQLEWKDIYFYLDQLPAATRYVCCLYYIQGFAIKEIAESINVKEGTVKWHLNQCRTRLKTIFDNKQNISKSG